MQQQSRDSFEKACQSMSEKYGVANFQRKLSLIQKQVLKIICRFDNIPPFSFLIDFSA